MLRPALKHFVGVIFIFSFALIAKAQQTHFVYLQTENSQPFYVKINNKVMSSSPAGYLILSKLQDGDHKLNVGFPKREFPEEHFQILIDKNNLGFLLKNFFKRKASSLLLAAFCLLLIAFCFLLTCLPVSGRLR